MPESRLVAASRQGRVAVLEIRNPAAAGGGAR
jgi:hypothetical protein